MPLGETWKYGIRVPSSLVAKCWLTFMPSASKKAGSDLSVSGSPLPISPIATLAGVR